MSLELWQNRLSARYKELAGRRSKAGWPLFALEHGLDEAALTDLENDVKAAILKGAPESKHPLPWIVYASEFGYRYSGYEYWQTFAEETPGWAQHGDRRWMRAVFERFAKEYHGAEPEGAWADHFSIIAWPITHAVLPKDLQRQLAQLLYEASHTFGPEVFSSADSLGQHLRVLGQDYSSRFRQFADNALLLGQIAAALLIEQSENRDTLLLPITLDRLVGDIEKEQSSREFLSNARSRARQLRLRGLRARRGLQSPTAGRTTDEPEEARQLKSLGFEPRLLARPGAGGSWQLFVEIPTLAPLAARYPPYREALSTTTGLFLPSGRTLARQALLFGLPPTLLPRWPGPSSPLVQYKGCPAGLQLVLESALRMPSGPRWLFKIQADGQALHVKSNVVHPGVSYLLLISERVARPAPGLTIASVLCEGIQGLRFDLPRKVDDVWPALLGTLGLVPSHTLEVWPAGILPALWDDEGAAHWVTGQEVILGVRADHPLEQLIVELDGHEEHIGLLASDGPDPIFVALGHMPEGTHRVRLCAVPRATTFERLEGFLDLTVRPPRAWSASQTTGGPLRFLMNPVTPTLEELWEGRVELHLTAPPWAVVRGKVSFRDERLERVLFAKSLSPLRPPITPEMWLSAFARDIRKDDTAQAEYDVAHSCVVELDAGAFGRVRFECERAFTPLRWSARASSGEIVLRLIDNSGGGQIEIREYSFVNPDTFKQHAPELATKGLEVDSNGGLYHARLAQAETGIIAIRKRGVRSLSELSVEPQLSATTGDRSSLESLLDLARTWGDARMSGSALTALYRRDVLGAIARKFVALAGGAAWENAERTYLSGGSVEQLKRSVASARQHRTLAAALSLKVKEFARWPLRERIEQLTRLSAKLVPELASDPLSQPLAPADLEHSWVWELALRVASQPDSARKWAGGNLSYGIAALMEAPVVSRAARFLILIVDRELGHSLDVDTALFAGWAW